MNPGSFVSTVCSGFAGPGIGPSNWDRDSFFVSADQATATRQAEDLAALTALAAKQGPFLGFLDGPYQHRGRNLVGLEASIGDLLDFLAPSRCLVPLGVAHNDHIETGKACRRALVARSGRGIEAIVYADLPYRVLPATVESYDKDLSRALTEQVAEEGFPMRADVEWNIPSTDQAKRTAVYRYGSQLLQLDKGAVEQSIQLDAEMFWHLATSD